jgi:hypothetical protein
MLERAEKLGLLVRFAELGNELFIPSANYVRVFPTAEHYAAMAAVWSAALTRRWPNLTVSVAASSSSAAACRGKPNGTVGCEERRLTWNRRLVAALRGVTTVGAASLHQYSGTTLPELASTPSGVARARRSARCPGWGLGSVAQQMHEMAQLRDLAPAGGSVARMLGVPFEHAQPRLPWWQPFHAPCGYGYPSTTCAMPAAPRGTAGRRLSSPRRWPC